MNSYQTIVVHVPNEKRARTLLEAGVVLARDFQAHLVGLHVRPGYRQRIPVPLPLRTEIAGRIDVTLQEEQHRIRNIFDNITTGQPVASEWRAFTAEFRDVVSVVLEHGRAADLIIASQSDPGWDMTEVLDLADELVLGSGGPVLVIPLDTMLPRLPQVVTVAWNGQRESARAVHDSLPLLQRADRVYLLTVGEVEGLEGALPETQLAASLSRHGVHAEVDRVQLSAAETVGEAIRTHAIARKSELLVMGCYGHSRLREFALGGATRHILRNMTVPVMLSH